MCRSCPFGYACLGQLNGTRLSHEVHPPHGTWSGPRGLLTNCVGGSSGLPPFLPDVVVIVVRLKMDDRLRFTAFFPSATVWVSPWM